MSYFSAYILSILLVNYMYIVLPPIDIGFGNFHPSAVLVGFVFVIRDFAQRAVGHQVMVAMFSGCFLSYYMVGPHLAIASLVSFFASEMVDWILYTMTARRFHERVLWSSIVATPVDTIFFLFMMDTLNPGLFISMLITKMLAGCFIYWYGEQNNPVI